MKLGIILKNSGAKVWLGEQIAAQKTQFFYWSPVFLSLGIGLYFSLPFEPALFYGCLVVMGAAAIAVLCRHFHFRTFYFMALAFLALPALGFFLAQIHTAQIYTPMITKNIGPAFVSGRVHNIEVLKLDYDARLVLSDLTVEGLSPEETPRLVRLRVRKDFELMIGDRISALAELMPLSEPVIPGGYDFRRHSFFEGIGAVGFVYKDVKILERPPEGLFDFIRIEKIRHGMEKVAYEILPEAQAAIVSALTVGKRGGISDEDNEAMRDSGLAHLLSISGLHLTLVCGGVFFWRGQSWPYSQGLPFIIRSRNMRLFWLFWPGFFICCWRAQVFRHNAL
jgi:competence protein ComEC